MMSFRLLWTKKHLFRHCIRGCVTSSMMEPKDATVGIDFGCKNSRVAIIESLVPQVIDSEIRHSTPSYVTLTELNSNSPYVWSMQHLDHVGKCVSVGQIAKYKMLKQPSNVVFNIKKLIGKRFDDYHIQEMKKSVYFSIVEGPRGEAWVEIHQMKFSPVDISSAIFAKLKNTVLMYQFHHKLQAVISVPAFFSKQQRDDIKLAGSKAGLDVLQVIDETTAAVFSSARKGIVVVFGMGAGSYSISILDVPDTSMKDIKVKAQSGDPFVGGDQFDNILLYTFVSKIMELHSVDIRGDKYAMTVLAEKMEQVKVDLSNQHEVTLSIPFFTASAEGPVDLNITISRPEFEKLVNDLIEQIKHKCHSTLKEANVAVKDIDEIVLFGGMTRMPKIQGIIYEVFGEHQISRVNPEEAVVIGSAIQAALFVEEHREMCEGMIPLSIGIESVDGTFTRIIPRNTTLPAKRTVTIPAWCAYREWLHMRIFLGEHLLGHHNLLLGEVLLLNNKNSHHGCVNFEVTFEVDKDCVVKVSATDASDQFEAADDMRKVYRTFTIDKAIMCKHNVLMTVRGSLLNWMIEFKDPLRTLAREVLNTLYDVLSARKDELPKDLFEDGVSMLSALGGSLDADVAVLKHKVQSAKSMVSTLLNWMPSESSELLS